MVVSGSSNPMGRAKAMAKVVLPHYSGTRYAKHGFSMRDTKGEEVTERAVPWLSPLKNQIGCSSLKRGGVN
jgi:hypothetical protein